MIKLGLTVLLEDELEIIEGKSIGLITNSTGVSERLIDNISLFLKHPDINLKAIFSPEHGLWGAIQDAISINSSKFTQANIMIYSLYGSIKKPTREMLNGLDAIIFDIQDVGTRFYTYITTMAMAMEACAENKIEFIVLDRPNPINGLTLEGNILSNEFRSFVGYYPILLRHGMTVGELAKFFNDYFNIKVDLHVVKMEGWKREMWFDDTSLFWVMPSPNMPTLDTAIVYPGSCLFEGTNISEGRGTTRPFEIIGAPWINPYELADELNKLDLKGVFFRPLYFIPTFSKYKDQQCGGVQIHVIDRNCFAPVKTSLSIIYIILQIYPNKFNWIYNSKYFFDLLIGTDKV
ncbi:MAG: exo-beta-N-acetylmuramidase NamZ family protein, partial [bacterium]